MPGERLTIARPLPGIEVLSVTGSRRYWRESHETFTVCAIGSEQPALSVEWRTRGRALTTHAGGLMAIEPGDVHVTERLVLPETGAAFDLVRFSPTFLAAVAAELGVRGEFHFRMPSVDDPATFAALRDFVATVAGAQPGADIEAACAAATHSLISRLAEAPRPVGKSSPIRDFRVRRLVDYLHAHLDKRPTLDELAAISQLSKWRLCAIFEQAYGISIGNYWRDLRSREAGRRLLRGAPIKIVVAELGYADEPHFSREFKAHHGLTPGRWLALSRGDRRLNAG